MQLFTSKGAKKAVVVLVEWVTRYGQSNQSLEPTAGSRLIRSLFLGGHRSFSGLLTCRRNQWNVLERFAAIDRPAFPLGQRDKRSLRQAA
jgi:hypothetical protein